MACDRVKCLPTLKRIPDELWDEIRVILPLEKPDNTIGRPAISFRISRITFMMNSASLTYEKLMPATELIGNRLAPALRKQLG